jgi:mannosylglycoprotein endo-beta-mannosidase
MSGTERAADSALSGHQKTLAGMGHLGPFLMLTWLVTTAWAAQCATELHAFTTWRACRDSQPLACVANLTLPATAFTVLLRNRTWAVDDPWTDDALLSIPDISVTGSEFWTFTYTLDHYVRDFDPSCGTYWSLHLHGVNYRVQVSWNFATVGPEAVGMFQRFHVGVPVTAGWNQIAMTVFPPDHPGNASSSCPTGPCGQGGNHALAQDVVSQYFAGWDWIGSTPDRNTGIYDRIVLKQTGPVLGTCCRSVHVVL